jgi:hypothetical protein
MLKNISVIDEDGKKIDNKDNLVILKTPDNMIHYIDIELAENIIKSLEGQIYMIKIQQEINGE